MKLHKYIYRSLSPEIKSALTYSPHFESGIRYFQIISETTEPGWIIYGGDLEFEKEHC